MHCASIQFISSDSSAKQVHKFMHKLVILDAIEHCSIALIKDYMFDSTLSI